MEQNKDILSEVFEFSDFKESIDFVNRVAELAEKHNHHPNISINRNRVVVTSSTHSAGNIVTDKDKLLMKDIRDLLKINTIEDNDSGVKQVKLFTDGGSRGNPGPSAIGFAILDLNDQLIKKESKYLGITTNNQAEYQGLKQGLEMCQKMGFSSVDIYMDSLLVVNQMKGIYKVKNRDLWPIYDSVREFLNNFKNVSFTHVPRELNKLADSMVNECLDDQTD